MWWSSEHQHIFFPWSALLRVSCTDQLLLLCWWLFNNCWFLEIFFSKVLFGKKYKEQFSFVFPITTWTQWSNLFLSSQDVEADHSGYVSDVGFRVSALCSILSVVKPWGKGVPNNCQIPVPQRTLIGVVVINWQVSVTVLWCLQPEMVWLAVLNRPVYKQMTETYTYSQGLSAYYMYFE